MITYPSRKYVSFQFKITDKNFFAIANFDLKLSDFFDRNGYRLRKLIYFFYKKATIYRSYCNRNCIGVFY